MGQVLSDAALDASTPPFIAPFPASLHDLQSDLTMDALMAEYLPLSHSEQPDWAQESWYLPGEQLKHAVKVDEFVAVLENVPRCGVESSECRGKWQGGERDGGGESEVSRT